MNIKIVESQILLEELRELAKEFYVTMIKGVGIRAKMKRIIDAKIK